MYVCVCVCVCMCVKYCDLHCSRSLDEMAESPRTKRVPGFEDFLVSTKTGKKKRQLPIAPRRRARASTGDDG